MKVTMRISLLALVGASCVGAFQIPTHSFHSMVSRSSLMVSQLSESYVDGVEATENAIVEQDSETAAVNVKPEIGRTLFIGNLNFDLTEGDIKDLVSEHVEVKSVKLPRDKVSNNGRGFCFVEVESDEDVEKAISALDGVESAGRRIRVSKSVPKDQVEKTVKPETRNRNPDTPKTPEGYGKIYVSNLPYEITNEELTDLFGEYGEVLEVYVPVNRMKKTGRGFAFVTMKEEDIANAIEQTHGKEVQGRPITSSIPLPPGEKTAKPRRSNTQCKLYIGNLSFYTTEDTLKELFEEFGTVSDCYVPLDLNRGGTSSRGFAFITMERNDAMVALAELDGCELDGRNIQVNEAQPKTPREPRE